jgi:hypothetical protein
MKKHLNLLIWSSLVALIFALPQVIHSMEGFSKPTELKTPSMQRIAVEVEQQGIIRQEDEQREKQEKIILWSSGIDQSIQYIQDLQNYNLTYGELLKVLEAMKAHYTEHKIGECLNMDTTTLHRVDLDERHTLIPLPPFMIDCYNDEVRVNIKISLTAQQINLDYTNNRDCKRCKSQIWTLRSIHPKIMVEEQAVFSLCTIIKDDINRKMEIYNKVTGDLHPLWNVFSKM